VAAERPKAKALGYLEAKATTKTDLPRSKGNDKSRSLTG
jgi:hypothetical protein